MTHLSAIYGSMIVVAHRAASDGDKSALAEFDEQLRVRARMAGERASKAGIPAELRQRADKLVEAWIEGIVSADGTRPADAGALIAELQRLGTAPYRPEDDDLRELALLLLEFGLLEKAAKRAGRDAELDVLKAVLRDSLGRRLAVVDNNLGWDLAPDAYKAVAELAAHAPSRKGQHGNKHWKPIAVGLAGAVIVGAVALWAYDSRPPAPQPAAKMPATQSPAAAAPPASPPAPAAAALSETRPAPAALPENPPAPAAVEPQGPPAPVVTTPPPSQPTEAAALAPGAIDQVLKGFTCAELSWTSNGTSIFLRGHAASADDKAGLVAAVAKLPGVGQVTDELTVLGPPLCSVIEKLEPARENNWQRALGLDLRVDGENALSAGKVLAMEVNAPSFEASIYVDLFRPDGKVQHLVPNSLDAKHRMPARALYTVGKAPGTFTRWTVEPPFGDHVVVALASRDVLFNEMRPETEDAAAYLSELVERVKAIQTKDPGGIAAAVRLIVTKAPN